MSWKEECKDAGRAGERFVHILDYNYVFKLETPDLRKLFQINYSLHLFLERCWEHQLDIFIL